MTATNAIIITPQQVIWWHQENIMLKYKLTSQSNATFGGTAWGENVTHQASGTGELCTGGWIHYYDHPLIAVIMNPIHADIKNPKLWECRISGATRDDMGLKGGAQILTTIREIDAPSVTTEQRIRFAILCVRQVCSDPKWKHWSDDWMSGKTDSACSAYVLPQFGVVDIEAESAVSAASRAVASASRAVAQCRQPFSAAAYAGRAAAHAAYSASIASRTLDLIGIAREATTH